MTRAEFLSLLVAMGATILADCAPSTVDTGGTVIVGTGTWWVEMDSQGTVSVCRVRQANRCTLGYVVVE